MKIDEDYDDSHVYLAFCPNATLQIPEYKALNMKLLQFVDFHRKIPPSENSLPLKKLLYAFTKCE